MKGLLIRWLFLTVAILVKECLPIAWQRTACTPGGYRPCQTPGDIREPQNHLFEQRVT